MSRVWLTVFFFQAEDGIRDLTVTGVQTCALPIFRTPTNAALGFPSSEEIPLFPNAGASSDNAQSQSQSPSKIASPSKNTTLQENSKLDLIRYVSGEFAKAIKPLPAGKEGFHVSVGKPLEAEMLDRAVATHGSAVSTGDNVQITKLEFRDHQIIVDLNGGGRGKRRWRDRSEEH